MKTYQAKYKDRHGKKKTCNEWYLTFNDRAGIRRRLKAYTNKGESSKLGVEIEAVMNNNGKLRTDADKKWFTDLMPRLQSKLIEWNVVDGRGTTDHLTTPLLDHLKVFLESRRAKACKEHYVRRMESLITKILDGCGFKMFSDINATAIEIFLSKKRKEDDFGEGTYNNHIRAIKTFTKWLADERDLVPNPLARMKKIKQTEYRKQRRILTISETERLLTATIEGERRGNMSAYARYLVYRVALECGLRYSEIKALRVLSFDFNAEPCTVRVEACNAKGKESDDLPLNDELTERLKAFVEGRSQTEPVFALPDSTHAAEMIRTDLEVAGIPYTDAANRDIDFHACRHSFVSNLFLAGVPAVVVQQLARHKNLSTTMLYSHVPLRDKVEAIKKLSVLTSTCPKGTHTRTTVDNRGLKNLDSDTPTALSA